MKTPEIRRRRSCTRYGHTTIAQASQLRGGETRRDKYNLSWQLIISVNLSVTGGWSVLDLEGDSFGNVQRQKAMRWIQIQWYKRRLYESSSPDAQVSDTFSFLSVSSRLGGAGDVLLTFRKCQFDLRVCEKDFVCVCVSGRVCLRAPGKVRLCLSASCNNAWISSQIGLS